MTDEKDDDGLDATERFLRNKARHDAERVAQLSAAREEATKRGKEPFSAEVLSQYFTPAHRVGDEHSKVVKALEDFESSYYFSYPQIMTLEEFGRKLVWIFSQAT
jgi:hypothetical protein